MFQSLQLRITIMFVVLAACVYVTVTLLGLFIFESSMTKSIDRELKEIASEIGHAVDIKSGTPHFRDWLRTVKTEPARSIPSIQLFDADGKLVESYGMPASVLELNKSTEAHGDGSSVRLLATPLMQDRVVKGFLQLQLSTHDRDTALRQMKKNAVLLGLLFLLGLSLTSYVVARRVTRPIQDGVEMLRSFMVDASHELNTPLTILHARTESLERKLSKLGIVEEDLTVAISSLDRLDKVVNDLLLLSEVEDPLTAMSKSPVDTEALLNQATEHVSSRFKEKGIDLRVAPAGKVFVKGNQEALSRLLSNLLENALRYTDEGGVVSVSIEATEKEVQFAVKDSGIGIPKESLPRIFDRFFRVDPSRSRASGGTGLGLAIVKAIVNAHHGKISVRSELGAGTTFTVVLPRFNGAVS